MRAAASITCSQLSSTSRRRLAAERRRHPLGGLRAARRREPERDRDGDGHQPGIGQRRELGHPHAVGEARQQLPRDLQAQSGLADAPGPDQRDEPVGRQQLRHLRELGRSADQLRGRRRQIRRRASAAGAAARSAIGAGEASRRRA